MSKVYSLIRFSSRGIPISSAKPANPTKANQPLDFLTFLAIAQKLKIDFLPITWQPALDEIGRGATGKIRESLINLQTSFAFKVPKDTTSIESMDETIRPVEIRTLFQALISELSILGHPLFREHPNVISLLGICWDVLPSGTVWPVFVFEKTPLGDLWRFAKSEEGKNMPIDMRLKLCADIANAITDLHQSSKQISLLKTHAKEYRYHSRRH